MASFSVLVIYKPVEDQYWPKCGTSKLRHNDPLMAKSGKFRLNLNEICWHLTLD